MFFDCLLYLFRIAIRPAAVIVANAVAVATTTASVMIVVVVVPISAVVVLVLIVILLVVLLLMLLMVMHLLGILLRILQPVPDGGIVLATSTATTSSSTATIIHGRGHSTQDRMVQVIVERRRRVTHASHRKATRETALVVQARNLRLLLLLLVGRHSLLLRVVLVRELWLLVMVVVGVTYLRAASRVNFGSFHVGFVVGGFFLFSAGHV